MPATVTSVDNQAPFHLVPGTLHSYIHSLHPHFHVCTDRLRLE